MLMKLTLGLPSGQWVTKICCTYPFSQRQLDPEKGERRVRFVLNWLSMVFRSDYRICCCGGGYCCCCSGGCCSHLHICCCWGFLNSFQSVKMQLLMMVESRQSSNRKKFVQFELTNFIKCKYFSFCGRIQRTWSMFIYIWLLLSSTRNLKLKIMSGFYKRWEKERKKACSFLPNIEKMSFSWC